MNKTQIIFTLLLIGSTIAVAQNKKDNDTSHFRRIEQVDEYIEKNYVEVPDYKKIGEKAISSMLASQCD